MLRFRSTALLLFAILTAVGCAGTNASVRFPTRPTTGPITRAEMEARGVSDPYEAVRLLRPSWLRPKVRTATHGSRDGLPILYSHNIRFGSVYGLRDFHIEGIKEIRYISGVDATTRWGIGHTGGVIEVIWVNQSRL